MRFIVFGEIHGTREAPGLFGDVVCALATKGQRLLVALELWVGSDEALQRAWAGPHSIFEAALIETMPDWTKREDGVTSQAMLSMLVRLHRLKTEGDLIDIVAFNGTRDEAQKARFRDLPGQGPHEAAQAENVRDAARHGRYDRTLVLVGNLHAQEQPVTSRGLTFEPMAMRLGRPEEVLSLAMGHGPGTVWNCQLRDDVKPASGEPITSDAVTCAAFPIKGREGIEGPPRLVVDGPGAEKARFDGSFIIPAVTASTPVRARR